jgi:hypothetical protein
MSIIGAAYSEKSEQVQEQFLVLPGLLNTKVCREVLQKLEELHRPQKLVYVFTMRCIGPTSYHLIMALVSMLGTNLQQLRMDIATVSPGKFRHMHTAPQKCM